MCMPSSVAICAGDLIDSREEECVDADSTLSLMVHWKVRDRKAFLEGCSSFTELTRQEKGVVYYGFTLADNDQAVCKEGYVSAESFLAHLKNVDGPLQSALKVADITHIEAHGPSVEIDKLRVPLADFPVTYWTQRNDAFCVPTKMFASTNVASDTTLSVMVYWKLKDRMAFTQGCSKFSELTKQEKGVLYYGFTLSGDDLAACKEGYDCAESFLEHLKNVDVPLKSALKVADITHIEAHGPRGELEKLRGPLADFPVTYLTYVDGAFCVPGKIVSAEHIERDTTLSIMVHWQVKDRILFLQGCASFAELTQKEAGVRYYGFTMSDGHQAVCKEGYDSAESFLSHLKNVDSSLQQALQVADISKIEVHGPKGEIDKLRAPLSDFPVTYWTHIDSPFCVPSKFDALSDIRCDCTLSVMVYWKVIDRVSFLKGCDTFSELTKREQGVKYYGFTFSEADEAVCKEGYDSAASFLSHLENVQNPLQAALKVANITKIEVHGPKGELENLRVPLADFPVTYWPYVGGAFCIPSQFMTPVQQVALDLTLSVMVYWKVKDYFAFMKGVLDFQSLTRTESRVKYYGFSMVGSDAVCKEGYTCALGFLEHLKNVEGPFQMALQAADIAKVEIHGPKSELDKLLEPLKHFPCTYWPYLDGAFFVPSKYIAPNPAALDATLSVMVHWHIKDEASFLKAVSAFQDRTKKEIALKYYGFAMNGGDAVCREGYDSADGFLAHLQNVDKPFKHALRSAEITRIEVHGPQVEVDKLRVPLEQFPVTYWGCVDGSFFAPGQYLGSLISHGGTSVHRCFLKDTLFKTLSHQLVPAHQLQKHAFVSASSGAPLRVVAITIHPAEERELVEICVRGASLTVTASHRVLVQDSDGSRRTVLAAELRCEDHVFCSGGPKQLTSLQRFTQILEVVEVAFSPDEPVEAFLLPPHAILTKGQAFKYPSLFQDEGRGDLAISIPEKKMRRGGMGRRRKSGMSINDANSIPATYDPWN